MPQLRDITRCLEAFAPAMYQESYDNSGLLVGDPSGQVNRALLTLDCIEPVVDEAIERGCELIIAHHPIVFKGLKSFTGKNYVERVILKAIRNNIAIYACHTNLDNVMAGVNARIASRLGLENTKILSPRSSSMKQLYVYTPVGQAEQVREALFRAGAGQLGNYSSCSFNSTGTGSYRANESANPFKGQINELHHEEEVKIEVVYPLHLEKQVLVALRDSHPYEEIAYGMLEIGLSNSEIGAGIVGDLPVSLAGQEFLKHLKSSMKAGCVRHTRILEKGVKRVAVCGGAGSFLLKDAIRAGADCFVTGDFKYHEFFDAEEHLMIADIGHYESEQFTVEIFSEILLKNFPTFAVLTSMVNTNPVSYYY